MNNVPDKVRTYLDTDVIKYSEHEIIFSNDIDPILYFALDRAKEIGVFYKGKFMLQNIYEIMVEPLKNSSTHGGDGKDNIIKTELFLAPNRFVASFFDGGKFFKRTDIKEKFENKIHPRERHIAEFSGGGYGTDMIFELSDFIYVDTNSGKLYLGRDMIKK